MGRRSDADIAPRAVEREWRSGSEATDQQASPVFLMTPRPSDLLIPKGNGEQGSDGGEIQQRSPRDAALVAVSAGDQMVLQKASGHQSSQVVASFHLTQMTGRVHRWSVEG